jgi:ferredoxin
LIEVLEGADWLEPPNEDEAELLGILAGPTENRLACQARVRAGNGIIKVRPTY